MKFAVITLFPEMFNALTNDGVVGRAVKNKKLELSFLNPRTYTSDVHKTVDDRPYGGGPGMVMMAEPLAKAIEVAKAQLGDDAKVIYFSPQGKTLVQSDTKQFIAEGKWILLCGRYEGVDQRLLDSMVDIQISLGDFVLSGGEIPAMTLIDMTARHIPGVLGNSESALHESFMPEGIEHPHYTRPETWRDQKVPEVLLSGNHQKIEQWRSAFSRKP